MVLAKHFASVICAISWSFVLFVLPTELVAQIDFAARRDFLSAESGPGDFNLDGEQDIAIAHRTWSIFLGDGTGGFSQGPEVLNGGSAEAIASGDFNGDGFLDIVVTIPATSQIKIYVADGGGGFLPPTVVSGQARVVRVGDVDADGNLDIGISWFGARVLFGDGRIDIACGSTSNDIRLFRGRGDGTFESPLFSFGIGGGTRSKRIAVGDYSGQGRPDMLLCTSNSKDISLVRNTSPQYPTPVEFCLQGRVQLVSLPSGAGSLAFNIPATGVNRLPKRTWNNFGHLPVLGTPDFNSTPAPSEVLNLSTGIGIRISFTLQGIIRDDGSPGVFPASPTNGMVIIVE